MHPAQPLSVVLAFAVVAAVGCTTHDKPAASTPPATEVSIIEVARGPVRLFNEYVAQTQAPETIEIRAQVTGLLERQAVPDGTRVKKGEVLYVIDRRPFAARVSQAKAALAQAEANLINAKQSLARNERLIAEKAVSQADYDNALATERAGEAVVEAQSAMLRDAELNLEFATIRAPADGFVSRSEVKAGSLINAQQTLLTTVFSSDPMWVYFTISEERLLELQKRGSTPDTRTPFRITLADGTEYALAGRLDFVDAAIDTKTGTLQVRLTVPNPQRLLRPGLFVRVSVPVLDTTEAIRVPQKAVVELQGVKSVFVVGGDGKVQPRQISASRRLEGDWLVTGGLKDGEHVVVEGTGKLRAGAAVKTVVARAESSGASPSAPTIAPLHASTK